MNMLTTQEILKHWQHLVEWCSNYFLNTGGIIQAGYIIGAFAIGWMIYHVFLCHPLQTAIDHAKVSPKTKGNLRNLKRLTYPALVLLTILFASRVVHQVNPDIDIRLSTIFMKLLLAWIGIRICVQFIANKLARNIFALTIWTIAALSIFGILDETTSILDALGFGVGNFRISALIIIKGMIALFMLLYFALFISAFFERQISHAQSLTRSSQVLINKIIRTTLIFFAILIGLTSAGIDLSAFTIFSGALGLGIGFGLQKVVSNLFSGMLLLMDKSINPGDVIELSNNGQTTFGWVNHMGARFTEIVSRDNKSFLIPNEELITQRVVNWSHGNSLVRLEVKFGVHYQSDPHHVSEVAIAAAIAADEERITPTPEPVCHLTNFGESSLDFSLRFWIKDAEKGVTNVKGKVMFALWDAFKAEGIQIPYPHREVFITEKK